MYKLLTTMERKEFAWKYLRGVNELGTYYNVDQLEICKQLKKMTSIFSKGLMPIADDLINFGKLFAELVSFDMATDQVTYKPVNAVLAAEFESAPQAENVELEPMEVAEPDEGPVTIHEFEKFLLENHANYKEAFLDFDVTQFDSMLELDMWRSFMN